VRKERKDIKKLDKYCEYCNNKLERKRYNGVLESFPHFKKRKFCDIECMRRSFLKKGNHADGSFSSSHITARRINELLLKKDTCESCGATKNLDIHHIDNNWRNNNIDNLMCVCRSCHMKIHRRKGVCVICGEPQKGHGYCNKHYIRFKKYGDALYTKNKVKEVGDVNE
jgi:hypothetical protein